MTLTPFLAAMAACAIPPGWAVETAFPRFGQLPAAQANEQKAADDFPPDIHARIRIEANEVLVFLAVKNKRGTPLSLTKDNFEVEEDRARQTASRLIEIEQPVALGLMADMSGSMVKNIPELRQALEYFLNTRLSRDKIFPVAFSDKVNLKGKKDLAFIDTAGDLGLFLNNASSGGNTPLFDAIYQAVDVEKKVPKGMKRVLFLVTDGVNNSSLKTYDQALEHALRAHVYIYAVAFPGETPGLTKQGRKTLTELAKATGGAVVSIDSLQYLEAGCKQIAEELRSQYVLGYFPTNKAMDGTKRHIKIHARTYDGKKLKIGYPSSYYALKEGSADE